MKNFAPVLIFAAAVLASPHAGAQEPAQQPGQKPITVDSIVVTARHVQEIVPAQILAEEQLQRLSSSSVADAIRYFSGVQIKDYGGVGGLKTVNVRSLGTHHTGVFYDGIRIGNAQNGVVDLGRFSLDNMEAVALYNGQKSAIFQPAAHFASASAIYMQTRRPVFDSTKLNNLRASIKGGSFKTVNPSVLWEHRFGRRKGDSGGRSNGGGNVRSSLNAEYLYTSGEYRFSYAKRNGYDTTEMRRNGDVRLVRGEMAFFGEIPRGEWSAKAYVYNSERGYPGASVREEPGMFRNQDRQWDTNVFAQGSLRKSSGGRGNGARYDLLLNAKYACDYLHYRSDPRLDVSTMWVDNRYRQHEAYISAANLFRIFEWWSANLSLDAQWNALNADLYGFVYPRRLSMLTAAATSMRLGRVSMQASLLHNFVSDKTSTGRPPTRSRFTPTVIVNWQPFRQAGLNLHAFYKRTFRMPTFGDLYYTFVGNIGLRPEAATQYNVGAAYSMKFRRGTFRTQADAYYNEVRNKIVAVPASNQFRWTMLNFGFVKIGGIDAALHGDFSLGKIGLNAALTYNFQRAGDFTDPGSPFYGDQIPYIPWHSGSAALGGTWRGWSLNYSFIYTGERYEQAANIPENYARPWYTHDLSLFKDISLQRSTLRAGIEVNNLLGQQYEIVQCYPMPGINFKIIFSITI